MTIINRPEFYTFLYNRLAPSSLIKLSEFGEIFSDVCAYLENATEPEQPKKLVVGEYYTSAEIDAANAPNGTVVSSIGSLTNCHTYVKILDKWSATQDIKASKWSSLALRNISKGKAFKVEFLPTTNYQRIKENA